MKEFKFFRGFDKPTITEEFERLLQQYPPITDRPTITWPGTTINPMWPRTTNDPIWQVNPGLIQYTPPSYNITTTPGTGTYTIPLSGTINTTGLSSLTTSNTNGITYTTAGIGGTLTTSANTFYNQTIK
jgi:hypothetical protein